MTLPPRQCLKGVVLGPISDYYLLGFVALPEEVSKILTSDDMLIVPEMTMGMPIDIPKVISVDHQHLRVNYIGFTTCITDTLISCVNIFHYISKLHYPVLTYVYRLLSKVKSILSTYYIV